jgi:hypothetical protein
MLLILNLVLAKLLPGFAIVLSNIDTALSLGPR